MGWDNPKWTVLGLNWFIQSWSFGHSEIINYKTAEESLNIFQICHFYHKILVFMFTFHYQYNTTIRLSARLKTWFLKMYLFSLIQFALFVCKHRACWPLSPTLFPSLPVFLLPHKLCLFIWFGTHWVYQGHVCKQLLVGSAVNAGPKDSDFSSSSISQ